MRSVACIILAMLVGLSVSIAFGEFEYVPATQSLNGRAGQRLSFVLDRTPLHFVANQGQLDDPVAYYARGENVTIFCTDEGLTFGFAEGSINLRLSGGRRVRPSAHGELPGRVNHFIGNNPALWKTNIPTFREVIYRDVYPGIDIVYSGDQRRLKYTFYLQPGADPEQIQMIYEGAKRIYTDDPTGELIIETEWGNMRDSAPTAHQEIEGMRRAVDISFRPMGDRCVGFALGDYNRDIPLTIDPGFSTYLGGEGDYHGFDEGHDIAVDSLGNVYVTGFTRSPNFPIKNAYDPDIWGARGCESSITS